MDTPLQLILPRSSQSVKKRFIGQNCNLFYNDPTLISGSSYTVRSKVTSGVLDQFIQELQGIPTVLTLETLSGLSLLCDEFQFTQLQEKIDSFRNSASFSTSADDEARIRISGLEERMLYQENQLEAMRIHFEQEIKRLDDKITLICNSSVNLERIDAIAQELRSLKQAVEGMPAERKVGPRTAEIKSLSLSAAEDEIVWAPGGGSLSERTPMRTQKTESLELEQRSCPVDLRPPSRRNSSQSLGSQRPTGEDKSGFQWEEPKHRDHDGPRGVRRRGRK
jgi:hypothetical protein